MLLQTSRSMQLAGSISKIIKKCLHLCLVIAVASQLVTVVKGMLSPDNFGPSGYLQRPFE